MTVQTEMLRQELKELLDSRKLALGKAYAARRFEMTCPDGKAASPKDLFAIWPTVLEFYDRPYVQAIFSLPKEQQVTQETFKPALDREMAHLRDWRNQKLQALVYKVDEGLDVVKRDKYQFEDAPGWLTSKQLKLAACVVSCRNFSAWFHQVDDRDEKTGPYMWYPQFLHDDCNTQTHMPHRGDADETEEERLARQALNSDDTLRTERSPRIHRFDKFSTESLYLNTKASKIAINVMETCGLDPLVTTVETMDKSRARVVCLKCNYGNRCDGDRRVRVMSWRVAVSSFLLSVPLMLTAFLQVQHNMEKHFGDGTVEWERISDSDTDEALRLEELEPARLLTAEAYAPNDAVYRCLRCRGWKGDPGPKKLSDVEAHLVGV